MILSNKQHEGNNEPNNNFAMLIIVIDRLFKRVSPTPMATASARPKGKGDETVLSSAVSEVLEIDKHVDHT
jgi:hypothetical protein